MVDKETLRKGGPLSHNLWYRYGVRQFSDRRVRMLGQLSRNWEVLAVRGLLAILFGIIVFLQPGISLEVLVLFLGAYLLIDGISAVITALRHSNATERWWVLLLEGVMGIIAGVLTLIWPQITAFVVLYVVAAWAITTGIFEIIAAIRLRKE